MIAYLKMIFLFSQQNICWWVLNGIVLLDLCLKSPELLLPRHMFWLINKKIIFDYPLLSRSLTCHVYATVNVINALPANKEQGDLCSTEPNISKASYKTYYNINTIKQVNCQQHLHQK